jgi:hypothetical protein
MEITAFTIRFKKILICMNVLYWICFWGYFFTHAMPYQPEPPAWGQAAPWMIVFNRGLGNSISIVELMKIPIFHVSLIVYLPCFMVTWPLGRFLSPELYMFGTNAQGLRLILVTMLSFAQWAFLLRMGTCLLHAVRKRPLKSSSTIGDVPHVSKSNAERQAYLSEFTHGA